MKVGDTVIVNDGSIHHGKRGKIVSAYPGMSAPTWNITLDDGSVYCMFEQKLLPYTSTTQQNSPPKFKIGDRVQINDHSSKHGSFGTIVKIYSSPSIAIQVELDNNVGPWNLYEYEVTLVQSNFATPPSPLPSKITFQKGDRVLVDYRNTRKTATIIDKAFGYTDSWNVFMDDGTKDMYDERYLTIVPKNYTTPPSGNSLTYTTNPLIITPSYWGSISSIDMGVDPKMFQTPQSCKHKWKFYMGLQEKYEYCETCNEKRDTDRRS